MDQLVVPLIGRDTWTNYLWLEVTEECAKKTSALLIYVFFFLSFPCPLTPSKQATVSNQKICDEIPGFYNQKPNLLKNSEA